MNKAPICPRCKIAERPETENRTESAYDSYCKQCSKDKAKAWREKNKDHARKYSREYKKRNREKDETYIDRGSPEGDQTAIVKALKSPDGSIRVTEVLFKEEKASALVHS